MKYHYEHICHQHRQYIRKVRKELGVTQKDLALTVGTGLRFITELENGKPTCQIWKILQVLQILGFKSIYLIQVMKMKNLKLHVYLNQRLNSLIKH